jgi:hypothetical protein
MSREEAREEAKIRVAQWMPTLNKAKLIVAVLKATLAQNTLF